jgi:hypothetical protein
MPQLAHRALKTLLRVLMKVLAATIFGPSIVTIGHIREMSALNYFVDGGACEPREETVLELGDHEAVVFEEFFVVGLWMPPHHVLVEVLLKFQVQLHQLTPTLWHSYPNISGLLVAQRRFNGRRLR